MLTTIFIMFAGLIPAIETHEVNLGHGGVYDGAVMIGRDDAGRLIFFDQDLATTVTLGDLFHRSVNHDALLGLGNDDHPQYLLHSELDSLAKLELAIGGADLIDGVEGNARYLRLDGANSPVHVDGTNNRVGVGLAAPEATLHLYGGDARLRVQDDDSSSSYFEINDVSGTQAVLNKVSSGVTSLIDFNPVVTNGTGSATFRFFRATNTTGNVGFYIYKGDGSATLAARISANGLSSYFNATGGNIGLKTDNPVTDVHLRAAGARMRVEDTGIGADALATAMPGIELITGGMNDTTARYGGAVKFMSSDPQLTTVNPKLLAAIVPRATETYGADIDGGMAIDFATTANDAGAATVPTVRMTVGSDGNVGIGTATPKTRLHVSSSTNVNAATLGTPTGDFAVGGSWGYEVGRASSGKTWMQVHRFDGTATAYDMVLQPSGGNVGIGTSTVPDKLTVSGNVTVTGSLNLAGQGGRLTMAGRPVVMGPNLLDNPDFNIWQRNLSQTCAAGGDAGGTMNYPQPGILVTGSDRWQMSRAGTSMSTVVSRQTPPAGLPAAAWCLKQAVAGGDPCRQYLFQAVPREVTRSLRGGWVSFAISHYMAGGSDGGTIAIYKTVSGTVTELASYAFVSTPDSWERLAIAAQVPTDAETLLVGIQSNLSLSGTTVSYVANAVLAAGRYVPAPEKASDPALSSLPPLPKSPAGDLADCQAYYEKGSLRLTGYSPDSSINVHGTMVHFNTAKAGAPTLSFTNFSAPQLASPNIIASEMPAYVEGRDYPQGFRFEVSGVTALATMIGVSADWQAECGEPL